MTLKEKLQHQVNVINVLSQSVCTSQSTCVVCVLNNTHTYTHQNKSALLQGVTIAASKEQIPLQCPSERLLAMTRLPSSGQINKAELLNISINKRLYQHQTIFFAWSQISVNILCEHKM